MGVAAAVALTLTACGGGNGDGDGTAEGSDVDFSGEASGTLKTLAFNPGDEVGQSRADLAEEKLGGVTVEMDTANFDAQKFATLAAAGNLPDVVQMDRAFIATYAQKGLLMPMDDCFAAQEVDAGEYWYPAVVEDVTWDGNIYAAPQFFQPSIIIVNKAVTEPAGVTADQFDTSKPDELVALAGELTQMKGAQPTTLGFDPDMPGSIATWFTVFGGGVMDDDGKPVIDDPKNVEALTFLKELMEAQGGYAEVSSFKQTWDVFGDQNQYVANQTAAGLWAQWYINVLAGAKDDVQLDAVPIKDLEGNPFAMAGGTALAIPAQAKNPVAACQWITTVTSQEAWEAAGDARAKTVTENDSINTGLFTGSPAADQAVRDAHVKESGNADFDKLITTAYDSLADTRTLGASPVGQPIDEAIKNAAGAALAGDKTPEQALADAQAQAMTAWDALDNG
ncbi:extracellular solute-binding protein [Tessaracoccus lubricantis]|uniref:Extracellular solute-binding protein n=2 Tax=Tessaracoccus lubricantis TaxID=545543 RepID=A0ABP9FR85_9ACTN